MSIEYTQMLQEARQYTAAVKGMMKKQRFNNQSIVHIAALAAEQFMVGYLLSCGYMAKHHSLDFLIDEVLKFKKDLPDSLFDDMVFMEQFQSWCSMECGEQRIPTEEELSRMVNALMGLDVVLFPNA